MFNLIISAPSFTGVGRGYPLTTLILHAIPNIARIYKLYILPLLVVLWAFTPILLRITAHILLLLFVLVTYLPYLVTILAALYLLSFALTSYIDLITETDIFFACLQKEQNRLYPHPNPFGLRGSDTVPLQVRWYEQIYLLGLHLVDYSRIRSKLVVVWLIHDVYGSISLPFRVLFFPTRTGLWVLMTVVGMWPITTRRLGWHMYLQAMVTMEKRVFGWLVGVSQWTMGVVCPYMREEMVPAPSWEEFQWAEGRSVGNPMDSVRRGGYMPYFQEERDSDGGSTGTKDSMDETFTYYYTPSSYGTLSAP
ncbi:hypothetical protein DFH27DRAFT_550217 [Peziza echinospora]|nr:hypothetical protein DFH27DRAFT_550217 [Peziza echinospora]